MKSIFTNRVKINLKKIGWITVAWLLVSLAVLGYEKLLLTSVGATYRGIDFQTIFFAYIIAGIFAGLTGGSITVIYFEKWLRTKPYWQALIMIISVYTVVSLSVGYVADCFLFSQENNLPFYTPSVQRLTFDFIFGIDYLRLYLLWLFILIGTIVALLVNDKYGPGVFKDFLLGKYFRPRREERIFMFLDLRGSTSIAEQLGEAAFFSFIKELFATVTPAIQYSKGEIYQYVGDEIIVSWKMKNGLENNNCISCFLEIQKVIHSSLPKFKDAYGIAPTFKAGIHYGYAMAGEIGLVKRDIAFSGDVLNTTARIQGKCNELGVDCLFSKDLLENLHLSGDKKIIPRKIGHIELRGKQDKMILYTI